MNLWFLPFVREGITPATLAASRGQVQVSLQLQRDGGSGRRDIARRLDMLGPGDVLDIEPRQILRVTPAPGSQEAEPDFFPSIELDAPDLPWTYSPALPAGSRLLPWIALVVIEDQPGVRISRGESHQSRWILQLTAAIARAELPDLGDSWAWAHAQVACETSAHIPVTLATAPDRTLARLIASRRLLPHRRYHACLVPAFRAGRIAGLGGDPATVTGREPAWSATDLPTELPAYHTWTFRTGAAGDFESLARRLRPTPLDASIPPMLLQLALPEGETAVVEWEAPLRVAGTAIARDPRPPAAVAAIRKALHGGAGVLGPPYYGSPWSGEKRLDPLTRWAPALNLTPMYRAAAGLGAEAVRGEQEAIVAAASTQLEDFRRRRQDGRRRQFSAAVVNRVKLRLASAPNVERERVFAPLIAKTAGTASNRGTFTIAGRRMTRKSSQARPVMHGETPEPIAATSPEIVYHRSVRLPVIAPLLPLAPEPTRAPDGLFAPLFPRPMSEPLAEHFPELMLPGFGSIPADGVLLVESNPAFVEAYLTGANQELNHELLWRGLPADPKAAAFRRFWGHADGVDDIGAIADWAAASPLSSHVTAPAAMVLLVRGELVRRYPSMLIAAVPAKWNEDGTRTPASGPVLPAFRGLIGDDVMYAGFTRPALAEAIGSPKRTEAAGWFLLLSENPGEPRFGLDPERWAQLPASAAYAPASTLAADAARLAEAARQRTFRAFLHASLLIRPRT